MLMTHRSRNLRQFLVQVFFVLDYDVNFCTRNFHNKLSRPIRPLSFFHGPASVLHGIELFCLVQYEEKLAQETTSN